MRLERPTAAEVEAARSAGIEPVLMATYGFADLNSAGDARRPPLPEQRAEWATRMIDLWRGLATPPTTIEVWNEPWVASAWAPRPDPAAYLALVKEFAKQAWALWPNVVLLVSADEGQADYPNFRRDLLSADSTGFLSDPRIAPTTHNYVETRSPRAVTPQPCTYDLDRFRCAYNDFKAHGHPDPRVWISEFGWESDTPGGLARFGAVTEAQQAAYTTEALEIFRASGMVAAAYAFMYKRNDGWSYNWLRPDNSEKPIANAVRNYIATH
jgi:hypothetical protein